MFHDVSSVRISMHLKQEFSYYVFISYVINFLFLEMLDAVYDLSYIEVIKTLGKFENSL